MYVLSIILSITLSAITAYGIANMFTIKSTIINIIIFAKLFSLFNDIYYTIVDSITNKRKEKIEDNAPSETVTKDENISYEYFNNKREEEIEYNTPSETVTKEENTKKDSNINRRYTAKKERIICDRYNNNNNKRLFIKETSTVTQILYLKNEEIYRKFKFNLLEIFYSFYTDLKEFSLGHMDNNRYELNLIKMIAKNNFIDLSLFYYIIKNNYGNSKIKEFNRFFADLRFKQIIFLEILYIIICINNYYKIEKTGSKESFDKLKWEFLKQISSLKYTLSFSQLIKWSTAEYKLNFKKIKYNLLLFFYSGFKLIYKYDNNKDLLKNENFINLTILINLLKFPLRANFYFCKLVEPYKNRILNMAKEREISGEFFKSIMLMLGINNQLNNFSVYEFYNLIDYYLNNNPAQNINYLTTLLSSLIFFNSLETINFNYSIQKQLKNLPLKKETKIELYNLISDILKYNCIHLNN